MPFAVDWPLLCMVIRGRQKISQRMHVVSREGLIKMKKIASRPQDIADIDALYRLLPPEL